MTASAPAAKAAAKASVEAKPAAEHAIATEGLGKDYGAHTAVASLDLTVSEGQIFGLLGPNGAGKTTAISMICGVVTPTRGTARVAGHDIASAPFAARRALGLVPQDLALYEEITARQNLAFFGSLYGLRGRALAARIAWALDLAGLTDRAGHVVSTFSGGMKRRLNLAAGLLHEPRVLVADEPTVGVDPQSRHHIFETIRALRSEHGMTVLYTSHYMEEVAALCERIAILDRGAVIASGRIDDMIADHGGGSIEIELGGSALGDADADQAENLAADQAEKLAADQAEKLAAALDGLGEYSLDGRKLRVVPTGGYGAVVAAVEAVAPVRAVHTLEADLETVFLTLTGKRLRDD